MVRNVYNFTDPQGYGALVEQGASTNRIATTQKAIVSLFQESDALSAVTDDEAFEFGADEAMRLYPNDPMETQLGEARKFADRYLERMRGEGASKKRAVMEAIGDGALGNHVNSTLQPDQIQSLQQGQAYRRTEEQAWYHYLMSLDDDGDKERFLKLYKAEEDPNLVAGLSDDDKAFLANAYGELDKMMSEDIYGAPDKDFPWWSDTVDFAMRPFNAGVGFAAGINRAAMEIAPADFREESLVGKVNAWLREQTEDLPGWQRDAVFGAIKAVKNSIPMALGRTIPTLMHAAETGQFAGVDARDVMKRIWDEPQKALDILERGAAYAQQNFTEGVRGHDERLLSGVWNTARKNLEAQATDEAFRQLGPEAKDEDIIAKAEQLEDDYLRVHAGSFLIEHPYISEFLITAPIPTGWGKVVGATRKAVPLVKSLANRATTAIAGSGVGQKTAERMTKFMRDYPLIAERMAASTGDDVLTEALDAVRNVDKGVEAFAEKYPKMAKALFSTAKGAQDIAESAAATGEGIADWWAKGFQYMGWLKRMGNTEPVQRLRRLVIAADQMAAGEVDIQRVEINKLVKRLSAVRGQQDQAHLFYLLDEPWSMARVDDDIARVYDVVIADVLNNRGRAASTVELVQKAAKKASGGKVAPELRAALDGMSDDQARRIADVVENPWSHVEVPSHLQDAFDAGTALKGIDQDLKELAGTMNIWRKVRQRKMGKTYDVPKVGKGRSRAKVKKVIREDARRAAPEGGEEALELRDRWVLTRGRFRDHWVPHNKWEQGVETVDTTFLQPLHKNMRHKSALRRKMNLEDSINRGLILNPALQFESHFASAMPKYTKGAQLKAIDRVMRAEGFAVRWDSRDVDSAMNAAIKYTEKAAGYKSGWEKAQLVIRDMETRADKIRVALQDATDFGGAVKTHRTGLKRRIRGLQSSVRKTQKAREALRLRQSQLDDAMGQVRETISRTKGQDYEAYTSALQQKYRIQDEAKSVLTRLRKVEQRQARHTALINELNTGNPSLLKRRAGTRGRTKKEEYAAQMGREETKAWIGKHSPATLKKKLADLEEAAIAKRIEARQLLSNHEAYRIAGESAAAESAVRVNVERVAGSVKDRLARETGLEWIDLRDLTNNTYKEYLRVVGMPGETFDATTTLIPKYYASYLKDIMPWVTGGEGTLETAVGAYETFMRQAVRPFQKTWRTMVTVPRLLYTAKNFTSSIGLGMTALGQRSLNPELQAVAMAASALSASDAPRAAQMAKTMLVHLKNETRTLEEVLAVAKKLGVTSQLEARIGTDVVTEGGKAFSMEWLPRAAESITEFGPLTWGLEKAGLEKTASVVKHLSPAYWARATENYQHLISFIGGLDDLTQDGIARAFEFHNKWAGNYRLLGAAEKSVVKDAFGFYGWARFIVPHIGRMVRDRPEVLANWVKARGGWERYAGKYTPVEFEYMPRHLRGTGSGAPEIVQPHTWGLDPQVAWYAAASMETPDMLSLSYAPFIEAIAGVATGDFSKAGKAPWELMGPAFQLLTELVTLEDEQGRRLPPLFDPSDATTVQDSLLIRMFLSGPGAAAAPWMNLYRLYSGRPEDKPYRLALTVGRQMLGIDNHVARLFGAQPRSIGGMTDPATGGLPGVSYHLIDHRREVANKLSRSLGRARDYVSRQRPIIERGIH